MGNIQEKIVSFIREKILPVFSISKDENDDEEEEEKENGNKNKNKWKKGNKKGKRKKKTNNSNKEIILKTDQNEVIITDEKSLRLLHRDLIRASKLLEKQRLETSTDLNTELSDQSLKSQGKKSIDSLMKEKYSKNKKSMKDHDDLGLLEENRTKKFSSVKKSFNKFENKSSEDDSSSEDEIGYKDISNNNVDSFSDTDSGEEDDDSSSLKGMARNKNFEQSKTNINEDNDEMTQNFNDKQIVSKNESNRNANSKKMKPRRKIIKQNWRSFSDIDEEEEEEKYYEEEEEDKKILKTGKHNVSNKPLKEKDLRKSNKQDKNIHLEETNFASDKNQNTLEKTEMRDNFKTEESEISSEARDSSLNHIKVQKTSVRKLAEMFNKDKESDKDSNYVPSKNHKDSVEVCSKENKEANIINTKGTESKTSDIGNDITNSVNSLFKNTSNKLMSILKIGKESKDDKGNEDINTSRDIGSERVMHSIEEKDNEKNKVNNDTIRDKETSKIETEWSKELKDNFEMTFKNIVEKFKQTEISNERKGKNIKGDDKNINQIHYQTDDSQMDKDTLIYTTEHEKERVSVNDNRHELDPSHNNVHKSSKYLSKFHSKKLSEEINETKIENDNLKDEPSGLQEKVMDNKPLKRSEENENVFEELKSEKHKKKVNTKTHIKSVKAREEGETCEKKESIVSFSKQKLFMLKKDDPSSNELSNKQKTNNFQKLSESSSPSDDFEIVNLENESPISMKMTMHTDANKAKEKRKEKEKEKEKHKIKSMSKYRLFKKNSEDSDTTSGESSDECKIPKTTSNSFPSKKTYYEEDEDHSLHGNKHIISNKNSSKRTSDRGRVKTLTKLTPWRKYEDISKIGKCEDEDEDEDNKSVQEVYEDLESGTLTPSNKIIEKILKKKSRRELHTDEEELLELYIQNFSRKQKYEVKRVSDKAQKIQSGKSFWRNRKINSSDDSEDSLTEKVSSETKTKSKMEAKQKRFGKLYRRGTSSDESEEEEEKPITKKGKIKVQESKNSKDVKNKSKPKSLRLKFKKSSEESEEESPEPVEEKGFILSKEESMRLLKVNFNKTKRRMKGEPSESEETEEEEVSKFSKLSTRKLSKLIMKEEEEPVKKGLFGRKPKHKKKSRFQRVITGNASKKKKKRRIKRRMCMKMTKMVVRSASKRTRKRFLGDKPKKKKPTKKINKNAPTNQKEILNKKSKSENLDTKTPNSKLETKPKKINAKKLHKQRVEAAKTRYS